MTEQNFIDSPVLGNVILQVITTDSAFKAALKSVASSIAADIESASSNSNCSCRNTVLTYISINRREVGSLLYNFATTNNILSHIEALFIEVPTSDISGKVAKTSITDWPSFVQGIKQSNYNFKYMSTSIVGDDVYVFFI